MQDVLTEALESGLPPGILSDIQETRSQYGLVKGILKRQGNLSPDGRINSNSLYGTMRDQGKIRRGDPLLKQLELMRYLETKVLPSSGSIERLLTNPYGAALKTGKAAAPYAIGGLGTAVGGSLLAD